MASMESLKPKWQRLATGCLLAALGAFAHTACSQGGAAERNGEASNVTPILQTGGNEASVTKDMVILEVDKSALKAELRTWPEDTGKSSLLMTFRIAIGKEEGDKQIEGDNKTPEGIYFSESLLDGSTLPAKYGPKAIPINFPNPHDQMLKKTGYGIWLHGVEADQRVEQAKVTEGCVAFYNADILTLAKWVKPHQVPIVIAKDTNRVNQEADLKSVRERTLAWLDAWRNRDVDAYGDFYGNDFRFGNMSLSAYRTHKARIFKSYQNMTLKSDSLRILAHPKYAMAIMNQDFSGDKRYKSSGRKILYWTKGSDGQWRIAREVFENRRIELLTFTAAEIAKLSENSPSAKYEKSTQTAAPNL